MQNYPVELLQSMLETYSPSGSENKLAKLLYDQMATHGFKVRTDQVGNVIGEIGEGGPHILFCGHMDTVPGEIAVQREGDVLYGRGAVDAKASLAAMLIGSYQAAQGSNIPFRLTLAAVVDEERSSGGVKALIAEGGSYDMAVFGEPSGASNIVIGYKGSVHINVTCSTKGGHSASPWLSKSSFEEAFKFWKTLRNSLLENESPSKFNVLTGCVTSAVAGNPGNTIPSHATLEIDIRIPPSLRAAEAASKIEAFLERYQKSSPEVLFHTTFKEPCEAYLANQSSSAVRAFRWAIKDTIGGSVSLVKKTGTSDMNLLAQSCAIPMIAYGPGDSSLDHTEEERISVREYLDSISVYSKAIQKFNSLARPPSMVSTAM